MDVLKKTRIADDSAGRSAVEEQPCLKSGVVPLLAERVLHELVCLPNAIPQGDVCLTIRSLLIIIFLFLPFI